MSSSLRASLACEVHDGADQRRPAEGVPLVSILLAPHSTAEEQFAPVKPGSQ